MDGENNGKSHEQMDDLGGKPTILGNPPFKVFFCNLIQIQIREDLTYTLALCRWWFFYGFDPMGFITMKRPPFVRMCLDFFPGIASNINLRMNVPH